MKQLIVILSLLSIICSGQLTDNLQYYFTNRYFVSDSLIDGKLATWYDESGNGNNATQSNTNYRPTIQYSGTDSAQAIFDGTNDYMTLTLSFVEDTFTICFDVLFNSPPTQQMILGMGNSTNYVYLGTNILRLRCNSIYIDFTAFTIQFGINYRFVITKQNTSAKLWINGTYIEEKTFASNQNITISRICGGYSGNYLLNGWIDEIRFYNRVLTDIEIEDSLALFDKSLAVYRNGKALAIGYKFNSTKDIVYNIDSSMFNNLVSIRYVNLNNNSQDYVNYNLIKTADLQIWNAAAQDYISPYQTDFGWIGANHGYSGELNELAANYTAGQSVMRLKSLKGFIQAGSDARTKAGQYFTYTGISGDSLIGVTCSVSLTTSDSVYNYKKTAINSYYNYYADGSYIKAGHTTADSIRINVVNYIYDPSTLDTITGNMDSLLKETVIYRIQESAIDIQLTFEYLKSTDFIKYYGMQYINSLIDSIYFAGGQNHTTQKMAQGLVSGNYNTYDCKRTVLKDNNALNISMYIDPSNLGLNRYLDATDNMVYTGTSKTYNQLIEQDTTLSGSFTWRGCYIFFENISDDFNYAYTGKFKGYDYIFLDWDSVFTDTLTIGTYDDINIIKQVGTLTKTSLNSGVKITTSGNYGYLVGILTNKENNNKQGIRRIKGIIGIEGLK